MRVAEIHIPFTSGHMMHIAALPAFLLAAALGFTLADDYKQFWSDEFNGPKGAPVDPKKWFLHEGNAENGWGAQELQYYKNDTSNAAHDGKGHLIISGKKTTPEEAKKLKCFNGPCQYTSAAMLASSDHDFTYGKVDIGLQLPVGGKGAWFSIRIMSSDIDKEEWPDCGEIRMLDWGGTKTKEIISSIFGKGYSKTDDIMNVYKSPVSLSDKIHKFSLEWEPNKITWLIDDKAYATHTPKDLPKGAKWVYNDRKFFLTMNLGIGGENSGTPDKSTTFPQILKVDYVRVSQKGKK